MVRAPVAVFAATVLAACAHALTHLRRGPVEAEVITPAPPGTPVRPVGPAYRISQTHALLPNGPLGDCACQMKQDKCSCQAVMEFMECISEARMNGNCEYNELQYIHSCQALSGECQSLELSCTVDSAECTIPENLQDQPIFKGTTTEEILHELRDLREAKCGIEASKPGGAVNHQHMEVVEPLIEDRMNILKQREEKMPEMHCEKHFEEWTYPAHYNKKSK